MSTTHKTFYVLFPFYQILERDLEQRKKQWVCLLWFLHFVTYLLFPTLWRNLLRLSSGWTIWCSRKKTKYPIVCKNSKDDHIYITRVSKAEKLSNW